MEHSPEQEQERKRSAEQSSPGSALKRIRRKSTEHGQNPTLVSAGSASSSIAASASSLPAWVAVADEVLTPQPGELTWLQDQIEDGELTTAAYTDRKTMCMMPDGCFASAQERAKPTTLRFGPMPQPSQDWSSTTLSRWVHRAGLEPSEGDFMRVRILGIDEHQSGPEGTEIRVIAEWNPGLALQHMVAKLDFHATNLKLSCQVAAMQPVGWKPRGGSVDADDADDPFVLRGCAKEKPAKQPPRFKQFPLRAEQLRSLSWMLEREARPVSFDTEVQARFVPGLRWEDQPENRSDLSHTKFADYWQVYETRCGFSWCYEARLTAKFWASGGVLGDAIGSGKTATLIGLLDSQRRSKKSSPSMMPEADHLIPTSATLILVPSNLLGQWEGEFAKFLGADSFNFLIIRTIKDLRSVTVEDLTKCEVVLTTYKILYSNDYVERLKNLQCTRQNRMHERYFLGRPIQQTLAEVEKAQAEVMASDAGKVGWTLRVKTDRERVEQRNAETDHKLLLTKRQTDDRIRTLGLCKDWKKLPLPVFELFLWQRIVFDEFHELEAMDTRRCTLLQNLRARHRWGLTGTPPKRDVSQIEALARMLRIRVKDDDRIDCQRFLDTFVRQNFSELPEIPIKEHVVCVQQTLAERALYLQREFDGNRQNLLRFCSHHCLQGTERDDDAASDDDSSQRPSARNTVTKLLERKQETKSKQQQLVADEYKILAVLTRALSKQKDSKAEAEAAEKLSQLEGKANAMGCQELERSVNELALLRLGSADAESATFVQEALLLVDQSRPGGSTCAQALRLIQRSNAPALVQLRAARTAQLGRCSAVLSKLLSSVRSLRFFQATLHVLQAASGSGEASDCPVCLDAMSPQKTAVLPCAHAFHFACICKLLASGSQVCPTCRAPFKQGDAATLGSTVSEDKPPSLEVEQFGSKLVAIGQTLKQIRQKDPKAKAIVFVQWKELEVLIGEALTKMGIDHIRLRGSTVQRSRLIANFQELPEPAVLLQSLENSASGANLTRASHVLLVHPMDADSRERAVAYEMQALGRVRRCGQTAKEVHLWRFVTQDTIEEEISKEHQLGVSEGLRTANGGEVHARKGGC
eukprot:TRINITY_DN25398_c0_g1_i1.p1 TRINITY_DN25398_c0_g1~~TRINITY_DN25398_c0_g1_i1.p1  ORF type:complete len:1093 (+),score=209.35 TRINITY_DN25398_c0_g1_i1:69-3347(+)